eukprot:47338-Eustigmatos_ZCMA.PRE.1
MRLQCTGEASAQHTTRCCVSPVIPTVSEDGGVALVLDQVLDGDDSLRHKECDRECEQPRAYHPPRTN